MTDHPRTHVCPDCGNHLRDCCEGIWPDHRASCPERDRPDPPEALLCAVCGASDQRARARRHRRR